MTRERTGRPGRMPGWLALGRRLAMVALCGACGPQEPSAPTEIRREAGGRPLTDALGEATARVRSHAEALEAALRPVPFLTGRERAGLRRHLNEGHVARARTLGIPTGSERSGLAELELAGALVTLPDSSEHWVIRELDFSHPMVTPDTRALLEELGERFQGSLDTLGLPPFRMELTSLLRTAESQRALRRENTNAASGPSAHQFGTTVDVAYTSFAAPSSAAAVIDGTPEWLAAHVARMTGTVEEAVARRQAGAMGALLGRVILEMQEEGKLLATMERQQAVFHLTVASPLEEVASVAGR